MPDLKKIATESYSEISLHCNSNLKKNIIILMLVVEKVVCEVFYYYFNE